MKRLLLALALSLWPGLCLAQNKTCPTRAPGDSTNACASTAFVSTGIASNFASPPPLGNIVPNSVAATTLSASGAVSGAGITALFSAPLPIGNVTPNAGVFTTLAANTSLTSNNILSTEFPGLSNSVEAAGIPGLDNPACTGLSTCQFMFYTSPTTATADTTSTIRIQRDVSAVTGGTSGQTKGALWVLGFSGKSANEFNWNAKFEEHNKTLASTGAQNVAAQSTIFKETPSGGGAVTSSWGIDSVCQDNTGVANPIGSCIGLESDTAVVAGAGTDTSLQRVGLQLGLGTFPGTDTGVHIGRGILFTITGNSVVDHGIDIVGGAGSGTWGSLWTTSIGAVTAVNGIDWTNITFSGNAFKSTGYVVDGAGDVSAKSFVSSGTVPTNSGTCAINTQLGGPTAGSFKANGACAGGTYILAMPTATNGWACTASDLTTLTDTVKQSGVLSATSATFTATTANTDLVTFNCTGF